LLEAMGPATFNEQIERGRLALFAMGR
jgi:hypothetical protein